MFMTVNTPPWNQIDMSTLQHIQHIHHIPPPMARSSKPERPAPAPLAAAATSDVVAVVVSCSAPELASAVDDGAARVGTAEVDAVGVAGAAGVAGAVGGADTAAFAAGEDGVAETGGTFAAGEDAAGAGCGAGTACAAEGVPCVLGEAGTVGGAATGAGAMATTDAAGATTGAAGATTSVKLVPGGRVEENVRVSIVVTNRRTIGTLITSAGRTCTRSMHRSTKSRTGCMAVVSKNLLGGSPGLRRYDSTSR